MVNYMIILRVIWCLYIYIYVSEIQACNRQELESHQTTLSDVYEGLEGLLCFYCIWVEQLSKTEWLLLNQAEAEDNWSHMTL